MEKLITKENKQVVNAKKLPFSEFEDELINAYVAIQDIVGDGEDIEDVIDEEDGILDYHAVIEQLFSVYWDEERIPLKYRMFRKDWEEMHVDAENMEFEILGEVDGVPFLCFWAGGDWTYPVLVFIYMDETGAFRAYLPVNGNNVDPYTLSPFDVNVLEDDDEFMRTIKFIEEYYPEKIEKYLKKHKYDSIEEAIEDEDEIEYVLDGIIRDNKWKYNYSKCEKDFVMKCKESK